MDVGEYIDDLLQDVIPLDCKRFVILHTKFGSFTIPVEDLKDIIRKEQESWIKNIYKEGN